MPTLRPFRDYDEKDVINLFTISGTAIPLNKGTLVKVAASGVNFDAEPIEMLGNYGDFSVNNYTAQRYGTVPKATAITAATDAVIGMTLFDMRETDENGEQLKYRPHKAAEMEAVISGQTMPIVTRGIFAYSGVETGNSLEGRVSAGTRLYPSATAALTSASYTSSTVVANGYWGVTGSVTGVSVAIPGRPIAIALGATDSNGVTLIQFDATNV